MNRPGPTEGDQGVAARILPALDGMHLGGTRHSLIDDLMDAPGYLVGSHLQGPRQRFLEGPGRGGVVELDAATEKEVRIQIP